MDSGGGYKVDVNIIDLFKAINEKAELNAIRKALDKLQSTVEELVKKNDQLITREIKAAFDSIEDALMTTNEYTRGKRLDFAEDNLLKNTNLDSSLSTDSVSNKYLMALSHYGLSFICKLRGDDPIAYKHILRVYISDPRSARTKLLPRLYDEYFKLKCSESLKWYNEQLEIINNKSYIGQQIIGKGGAALTAAGAFLASSISRNSGVGRAGARAATKQWNDSTADKYRYEDKERLSSNYEDKIDEECREIAEKLIKKII